MKIRVWDNDREYAGNINIQPNEKYVLLNSFQNIQIYGFFVQSNDQNPVVEYRTGMVRQITEKATSRF